tara:strand:- start:10751 stop:11662 length:912 start_codon:yes stop_codon:yes gene_type:complete
MTERKLNLDVAGAVSELELLLKRVLPRNIMYQMILGKGLEFDGYRDYTLTDDSILIDWKATLRAKKTLVRKYIEERDLKFIFLVDVSDNMVFGSTEKLKCEYVAELSAAVSHLILNSGDRFGFFLYNNKIVTRRPPELGKNQFDVFVHELSNPMIYEGASNLNNILSEVTRSVDTDTSMIFIVSDFINLDETYKKNLELLAGKFEVVAIIVRDPLDIGLPDINKELVIENPVTNEKLLINPSLARSGYESNAVKQLNSVKEIFKDNNIDFIELSTKQRFAEFFAAFLQERIRGGRVVRTKNVR